MMRTSLVHQALDAYRSGNYALALSIYRELGQRLGQDFFSLNIALCRKHIRNIRLDRDYARIPLKHLKVACIMDDFTFASYTPECRLLPLSPQNGSAELQEFQPDLLFVESVWNGRDGLWNRKVSHSGQELKDILDWCCVNAVPTLFWNKEDPVHFTTFLSTAQLFDYIFTTDIDCIAQYKAALGHERVYLLPFACQPKLQNPIEHFPRKDAFCFAGAYYVRYPERTQDLEIYVESLPAYRPLEIFDRNFGKEDVNYKFPEKFYKYIVGTLPYDEIDKAYKGYNYAINLNSIKNSQSMFARRVYELLASNTITVSNYSRGMRLMLGELVLASDNGKEIIRKLEKMDDCTARKFRLAGLRKVLLEHTYEHRLAHIAKKLLDRADGSFLPVMVCAALTATPEDAHWVMDCYRRQSHVGKRLLLVLGEKVERKDLEQYSSEVTIVSLQEAGELPLSTFLEQGSWLTLLSPHDYYGPNYLLDIALASKYCDYSTIGKLSHYHWAGEELLVPQTEKAYSVQQRLPYRCCAVSSDALSDDLSLGRFIENAASTERDELCLAVDPFNYCQNGRDSGDLDNLRSIVDDQPVDAGIPINDLLSLAESIPPAAYSEPTIPHWDTTRLFHLFRDRTQGHIQFAKKSDAVSIHSTLAKGAHEYVYANTDITLTSLPFSKSMKCFLDSSPGLSIQYVFIFLDADKGRISHVIFDPNKNQVAEVPEKTVFIRFGIRVYDAGTCTLKRLLWGHRSMEPDLLLQNSPILLLTNQYPEYDNLYRNAFVHSRVRAYRERGVPVDVFRLRSNSPVLYYEFEGVDVAIGSAKALRNLLRTGRCKTVLVHFLSSDMWDVLKDFPSLKIIVWVHGAEIHSWSRREFNYRNEGERAKARKESEQRITFWRKLLTNPPANFSLVFVSRYFAEEVMEDLRFRLPESSYSIIHNPIDTELFAYHPKNLEHRKKILSIHPYSSAKYANDLSVEAIKILAKEPFFSELEFRMIGEGPLFDEILEPVKTFPNVICERRFLTQREIAILHREYGVFLSPTRWDSQGVSRNEAMASGLVPVTSNVAAISEFIDTGSGILAPAEDASALAEGIGRLYRDAGLFSAMSHAASERVRSQAAVETIIPKELNLFKSLFAETHLKNIIEGETDVII